MSWITIIVLCYTAQWHLSEWILGFGILGFMTTSQILAYPVVNYSNSSYTGSTAMSLVSILVYLIGGWSETLFGAMVRIYPKLIENYPWLTHINAYQFALLLLPIAFLISLIAAFGIKDRCDF